MRRLTKITATACAIAVLFSALGYAGYRRFITNTELPPEEIGIAAVTHSVAALEQANTDPLSAPEPEAVAVLAGDSGLLSDNARIIYRYHYLRDGHLDVTIEDAPYFLVGLNRTELAEKLTGWDLVEFSPQLAVFEKRINARSTERYTVGVLDGFITVFYDEEVNGSRIKEQTEIPVDALPEEELARLEAGIRVVGEEQLAKVLEDYSS